MCAKNMRSLFIS